MDSNTMYAAAMIGKDVDYQDDIIREVWTEDGYANMTESKANDACEDAYEKHGADVYNKCRAAGISCGKNASCDAIFRRYAKALSKNYKGTFEDFKKRSASLSNIGQLSLGYLGEFLTNFGQGGGGAMGGGGDYCLNNPQDPVCEEQPRRTGLYIVLGLVAAAGIGTAIYFATKKD